MRNFIGTLSEVSRPPPRAPLRGGGRFLASASCAPLFYFALGLTLAVLLPLIPGFVYRGVLPRAAYSLLLDDTQEPRVTHVNVAPPACEGSGATHIHMLISCVGGVSSKLALTLPSNMRALGAHLGTVYLLTSPEDDRIVRAAAGAAALGLSAGVEVFQSRIFTHRGAMLNMAGAKSWLHATAAGACARAGRLDGAYFLSLDADVLLPLDFAGTAVPALEAAEARAAAQGAPPGATLYSMVREFFATPEDAAQGVRAPCPPPDRGGCEAFLGYFQLFSAATRARFQPWSPDVAFYDNFFRELFGNFTALPGKVAHLGKSGGDWTGIFVRDNDAWEGAAIKGYTHAR